MASDTIDMKRPLKKEHASENVSVGRLIMIAGDVYFFKKENCRPHARTYSYL